MYSSDRAAAAVSAAGAFWGDEDPLSQLFNQEFSGFLNHSQELPDWAMPASTSLEAMPTLAGAMGSSSLRPTPTTSSSQTPQSMSSTQQPFSSWNLASHISTFPLSSRQAVTGAAPPSRYFDMAPLPVLSPSASHEMQVQAQRMFAPELGMHATLTMAQPAAAPPTKQQPQQRRQQQQQPLSTPPVTHSPPSFKAEPQPKAAGRKPTATTGKGRAGAAALASPADSKPARKSGSSAGVEPPANPDGKRLRGGDINKDKVLELEALLQQVNFDISANPCKGPATLRVVLAQEWCWLGTSVVHGNTQDYAHTTKILPLSSHLCILWV